MTLALGSWPGSMEPDFSLGFFQLREKTKSGQEKRIPALKSLNQTHSQWFETAHWVQRQHTAQHCLLLPFSLALPIPRPRPWHSLVTHSLGHRLLGWGDLHSGRLPHGLDPGLLLLRALSTEEVGANPSMLSLWGEAVRGTGPGLVHPAHGHL